ncbi:MAG: substrate-binding and VWA domain-containing protein [Actinomycetota bacterium]|nr:substrate-binding and VWA domain-containing protein [Actinomycetota bacterium]
MSYGDTSNRRNAVPLVVAIVVGIALVLGVRYLFVSGPSHPGAKPPLAGAGPRKGCVLLAITASSEKAALLGRLAADYNRSNHKVHGSCVDVTVSSKASGGAMEALARGWDSRRDGPRPDVWTPASTSWTVLLQQRLSIADRATLVPASLPSIAQTPLVIAMPRPMAQALGWPRKALGWGDLLALSRNPSGWGAFGHPEWGRFTLGKTNPDFSTSGLNATIGTYFAATGRSSDLTAKDIRDPHVVAYVKGVEASVVHYGDTTLTFLANLQAADRRGQGLTYISAVTVEEKSVWDYNVGNPSGDPKTLGKAPKPHTPLVAIYPKEGTLLSDNPYAVLTAPWVSDTKNAAAKDFLAYVQADPQQRRFQQAAFRNYQGKPGGPIVAANGLLPQQKFTVIAAPSPPVLQLVAQSWDQLRKRARVLLVLDVSGSMGEAAGSSGMSKLDLAKRAATTAIGMFAPDDEVGLWTFSTGATLQDVPYNKLVRIGPVRSDRLALLDAIKNLVPEGGTALYATTKAAQRELADHLDPTRINAVVLLTDGKNEFAPDSDITTVIDQLNGASESTTTAVRVFPIAYGSSADLGALRRIAEASRAAAYDATDPESVEKVLTAVISNF